MSTDLPRNIIKLIIALLKHQAENVLGKDAIGIAGDTLVDIGGEKIQGKIDIILNTSEGAQKLVGAALRADSYFREKCTDRDLRDAFTMPVGDLPSIQAMLKDLPNALDQENALAALRNNLASAFPNLKKDQIEYGASLYFDCINRALLPLKDFTLLIIGQAVLESKADIQESKTDIKEIKAMVEDVLQRIILQQMVIAEIQPPTPEFDPDILDNLNAPGGALKISDQFYVERNADYIIKRHIIKEGATIIIRASHQTGKSSLLARGIHHANSKANIVHINLQGFEHRELEIADTFYKHFARIISKKLKMDNSIVDQIWSLDLSSQSKLNELIEEYILPSRNQQIILALDEADRLLNSPFRNDFFGLMRTWHNNRSIDEQWNKLNLVLVISTEPSALISSYYQSPFNVGVNIYLDDFNQDQVYNLNKLHGLPVAAVEFDAFFELLSGHPFLTREVLYLLVSERWTFQKIMQDAVKEQGPFSSHLMSQFNMLSEDHNLQKAFIQISQQHNSSDKNAVSRLLQTGLVKGRGDLYYCRCGLYKRYFESRFR